MSEPVKMHLESTVKLGSLRPLNIKNGEFVALLLHTHSDPVRFETAELHMIGNRLVVVAEVPVEVCTFDEWLSATQTPDPDDYAARLEREADDIAQRHEDRYIEPDWADPYDTH